MLRFALFLSIFFTLSSAQAFVQNTTHGYPTCVACHVSPNGGGLLTDYGRALSDDVFSTWKLGDTFSQPLFGALKNSESVKYGGDIRVIQANVNNNNVDRGKLFLMQQNAEVGIKIDNVMLVGTVGTLEGHEGTPNDGQFLSERHYAVWTPTMKSRFRAGKFRQTFGIFTDNHERLIKNQWGFGSLSETYNMEFTQIYDDYELTFGSSLGRMDNPNSNNTEKNFSGHFTHYLGGHARLGASLLMGESNNKRRFLSGVNAVFALDKRKRWITMFELDYERSHLSSLPQNGVDTIASLIRVGHTLFQGFMGYAVFEHLSRDDGRSYSLTHQPGLGIQWLPVAHFNLQLEYLRQVNSSTPGNPTNITFFMFHYYL